MTIFQNKPSAAKVFLLSCIWMFFLSFSNTSLANKGALIFSLEINRDSLYNEIKNDFLSVASDNYSKEACAKKFNMALAHFQFKEFQQAESILNNILTQQNYFSKSDSIKVLAFLSYTNAQQLKFTEAKINAQKLEALGYSCGFNSPKYYPSLDKIYSRLGNFTRANEILYNCLKQNQNQAYTHVKLANNFIGLNQPDSVIFHCKETAQYTAQLDSLSKLEILGLSQGYTGLAYVLQGKFNAAIPLLKSGFLNSLRVKDSTNTLLFLNFVAFSELKTAQTAKAKTHLLGAYYYTTPNSPEHLLNMNRLLLAEIYTQNNQNDSADYMLREASIKELAPIATYATLFSHTQIEDQTPPSNQNAAEEFIPPSGDIISWKKFLHNENSVFIVISISLITVILTIVISISNGQKRKKKIQKAFKKYAEKTEEATNALLEKDALMKEIHHRVKNNMQVVSGILELQSLHSQNDEFKVVMKESQNRIQSMALIHQLLYHNEDIQLISFKNYVEKLSFNIKSSLMDYASKIKVNVIIDDVKFNIEKAVPLGLITVELLTNSIKYAYPKGTEGEIDIWLKKLPSGELEYQISDNGPGLPEGFSFSAVNSFGFKLVNMMAKQLKGRVDYKYNNGAIFTLKFNQNA